MGVSGRAVDCFLDVDHVARGAVLLMMVAADFVTDQAFNLRGHQMGRDAQMPGVVGTVFIGRVHSGCWRDRGRSCWALALEGDLRLGDILLHKHLILVMRDSQGLLCVPGD